MPIPRNLRTYGPPRFNDAHSFNGHGRLMIQRVTESPLACNPPLLVPDGTPQPIVIGPDEPRG
jgi:hypothetical protein